MDKARELAVDILKRIIADRAYSSIELDEALLNSNLLDKDKAFVTNIVYGTLNNLITIDRYIEEYSSIKIKKMEHLVSFALRSAVYQIKFMDRVPSHSAINETVTIVKKKNPKSANFVNGVLRAIDRDEKEIRFKSPDEELSFKYSMPLFLVQLFRKQYKKRAYEILEGLKGKEGIFIRINRRKISKEEFLKGLKEENPNIEFEDGLLEDFIFLKNPGSIRNIYGYDEGYFSVQNESAGLVSRSLEERKQRILDLCSAPGGKSLYAKEILGNRADITSCDIYSHKLKIIESNSRRLGLPLDIRLNDARILNSEFINKFDALILDVPCSGLGLLSHKPDIKINITEDSIEEIILLQREILENACQYIKDDGYIIYSTCTLNKEENENQIRLFLEKHPDFTIEKIPISLSLLSSARTGGIKNFIIKDEMITMLPDGKYDGFFIAKLSKRQG